jgi:hypothetical protein
MRRLIYVLLTLLVVPISSFALEVREGRLKLLIHEATARFSLYYLVDLQKDQYEPLFVDKDPRTSFMSLIVDDRSHRLGESTAFRFRTERTEKGARNVFESSTLVATQDFSFARLSGSTLADTLRIDFNLINKSDRELNIGLRMVFDTNLGEKKAAHFRTDKREITSETTIVPKSDGDAWWITDDEKLSFMGSISVKGYAPPDLLHFANWKRLNDAPWKAQASAGRNFNLLPYSIGDSALSYYFDPKPLARGAERKQTIFVGASNPKGFEGVGEIATSGLSQILQTSVESASSPDLTLQTDLITVRDVLTRVDLLLKSPESASDDEISALETVIVRLKERNKSK